ncbi:MAG: hypothetical protein LBF75_08635 [Treponema sp.]|jgi:hypothetical protein|nr:hypothetical protein [Treponema sp.]
MGLLYKAVSRYALKLDDKGKKLRDRILRIAEKGTTPYTALSLLKTYGSFQCGICLCLIEGTYIGYASVGLGIEKTIIPPERLPPGLREIVPPEDPAQRKLYYKIGSPALLSITAIDPQAIIWAFPLDDAQPCRYILLLAEEVPPLHQEPPEDSPFNPPRIARILGDISAVLRAPPQMWLKPSEGKALQKAADEPKGEHTHEATKHLEQNIRLKTPDLRGPESPVLDVPKEIFRFYSRKPPPQRVQGILFALSGDTASVLPVLAPLGSIIPVAAGYLLVLFQKPVDRELLAHRLSQSVGLRTVLSFEADTPEALLALLRPYSSYGS